MTQALQPGIAPSEKKLFFFLAILSFAAVLANGCAVAHRRATIPWGTAVLVRPNAPEPADGSDLEEPLAAADIEIPPPAEPVLVVPTAPARPRVAQPSLSEPAAGATLDVPQFVPDLSPQQSASFQQETEQNLSATQRSLASVAGKPLNPAQTDLLSKVRSFLQDARDAARAGDWARARDLSRKARVLSDQLAASF